MLLMKESVLSVKQTTQPWSSYILILPAGTKHLLRLIR